MEKKQPRKLESVAEVAEFLRPILERVKGALSGERDRIVNFKLIDGETRPINGHKGEVWRIMQDDSLENIEVSGMTPQQAVKAALSLLLGEPQVIPPDAADKNMYVVKFNFAVAQDSKVPTLRADKIDKAADVSRILMPMYQEVIAEQTRPTLTPYEYEEASVPDAAERNEALRSYFWLSRPGIEVVAANQARGTLILRIRGNANKEAVELQQARLAPQAQTDAQQAIALLRKSEAVNDQLIWNARTTDMTWEHNEFGVALPADGAKFHLMEVPKPVSQEVANGREAVRDQVGDAIGAR